MKYCPKEEQAKDGGEEEGEKKGGVFHAGSYAIFFIVFHYCKESVNALLVQRLGSGVVGVCVNYMTRERVLDILLYAVE